MQAKPPLWPVGLILGIGAVMVVWHVLSRFEFIQNLPKEFLAIGVAVLLGVFKIALTTVMTSSTSDAARTLHASQHIKRTIGGKD